MANGIWVEMMEFKTVVVKKTPEKGARGGKVHEMRGAN
jgi:hypothetical protein